MQTGMADRMNTHGESRMQRPITGAGNTVTLMNNGDGRYARYFTELDRALRMINAWARGYASGTIDGSWHANYLRGLAACFTMLRSRYSFESSDSFMVDLSHSGFPHSFMLTRIATDRAEALAEHFKSEPLSVGEYKVVFLDDLFATGQVNPALLNRIASAQYAEVVAKMDGAFDPRFMCGEPVSVNVAKRRYRLQWAAFDPAVNLPVLCGMAFEHVGADLTRSMQALKLLLKHETSAGTSIVSLAERIDSGNSDVRPLVFTRVTVGPIHLPGFTDMTDTVRELSGNSEEEMMIELIADHTHAVSIRKTSVLAVKLGVSPAEQLVYATKVNDPLCFQRGAEQVERLVILPHRMLQDMAPTTRSHVSTDYTLIPYTQEGEIQ
jgi:hypothetical protein